MNASTIRFYERRGLMPAPQRQDNGYRSYDVDDVRVVRLIAEARGLGFPLSDVERLMARLVDERRDKRRLLPVLEAKLALLDEHRRTIEGQRAAIVAFIGRLTDTKRG